VMFEQEFSYELNVPRYVWDNKVDAYLVFQVLEISPQPIHGDDSKIMVIFFIGKSRDSKYPLSFFRSGQVRAGQEFLINDFARFRKISAVIGLIFQILQGSANPNPKFYPKNLVPIKS
jgi:hypothetical protein